MRVVSIPPILIAMLFAFPLAAQEPAAGQASIHPLPQILAPRQVPIESGVARMDPLEAGAVGGSLLGATLGGVYGAFFADECGVEDECMLSREVKAVTFVVIGGALGGIIGAGTNYLLNRRATGPDSAPLHVSATAEGGMRMRMGMTLRH